MTRNIQNAFVFFILFTLLLSTANIHVFSFEKTKKNTIEKTDFKSSFVLKSVTLEATFNALLGDYYHFDYIKFETKYTYVILRSIKIIEPKFENFLLKILFSKIISTQGP